MDLYQFQMDIHQNACDHGWWEGKRTGDEIVALIHSEWSEALEEYRAGRPMLWHDCADMEEAHFEGCGKNRICTLNFPCAYRKKKPEGIAVELIDGCIRILDYLGMLELRITDIETVEELIAAAPALDYPNISLPPLIANLHLQISEAYKMLGEGSGNDEARKQAYLLMYRTVAIACAWIKGQGFDPEAIMMEKHQYNRTRPYKHGGKAI